MDSKTWKIVSLCIFVNISSKCPVWRDAMYIFAAKLLFLPTSLFLLKLATGIIIGQPIVDLVELVAKVLCII